MSDIFKTLASYPLAAVIAAVGVVVWGLGWIAGASAGSGRVHWQWGKLELTVYLRDDGESHD